MQNLKKMGFRWSETYEFWFTLVLFIQLVLFLLPIPLSDMLGPVIGILILVKAKNDFIKEKFGLDDIVYLIGITVLFVFVVIAASLHVLAGMSFAEVLVLGLLFDAISIVSGMVPIVGDIIGAFIAFIIAVWLFGFSSIVLVSVIAFLVLIPGPIPFVTIVLLVSRFLVAGF